MNGLFLRVHLIRFVNIVSMLLLISNMAFAQEPTERRGSKVIDDTTKQIYGPKTSRYFFEDDIFMNRQVFHFVDTAIRDFHHITDVQRLHNFYQDLGNIGTAIQPLYYQAPRSIGARSGYYVYDVYWDRERIKYWDTKSTYTNMRVDLGGFGRAITKASYSRNINPRWNFGFNYRGILSDKQFNRNGKGDRNVEGTYYDLFTTFQSKDSTYRVFANFQRNKHTATELGGVRSDVPQDFPYIRYFDKEAQPKLLAAYSSELRTNFHLFHQYSVGSALQLYHKFDRERQGNRFADVPSEEPSDPNVYFDYIELPHQGDTIQDYTKFKTVRNEVGVKGSLAKFFYNGYYAIRKYSMQYQNDTLLNEQSQNYYSGTESYVGGSIALNLDSLVSVGGWAELLLNNGNYRLEGKIASKWFDATLKQLQYEPAFLSEYYRGSHDFWKRDFSATNSTQLSGNLHYTSPVFSISPGITLTRIGNYVYFKSDSVREERTGRYTEENPYKVDVLPFQTSEEIVIASPQLKIELRMLRHLYLRTLGVYTKMLQDEDNAIDVPELFVNSQVAYENIFFNDNFDMQGGIEVHWKSPYHSMAYDAPTQQFYIQGDWINTPFRTNEVYTRLKTPDFPVIDIFIGARIKRGRVYFRYNNVLNAINKEGTFPTPFYPGTRSLIDFGFDWSFYD
jgi:hypothetical protein